MAKKYLKTLLHLQYQEAQIKTTVRFHFIPVKMIKIRKTGNKCWRDCRESGSLIHSWWDCKLVQPLWNSVWKILKRKKKVLSYGPAVPRLCIIPKGLHILLHRNSDMFTAVFINSRRQKQLKCPSNGGWRTKIQHIYTVKQKHELMNFPGKWVKLAKIIVNKVTKTQNNKCCMFSFI